MKKTDEKLKEQISVLEDKFKRLLADYQNQEKRYTAQKSTLIKLANETLINKILPVLDDLERAQRHLNDAGLGHVIKQLHLVLQSEGLTEIESDGADFSPEIMDCAEVVAGPKNKVIKTVAKGYRLFEKVLRPAKVEVGSGALHEDPALRDNTNSNGPSPTEIPSTPEESI